MATRPLVQTQLDNRDQRLADFRNFLFLIWKHVRLPAPSIIQYDIADFLQDNKYRRKLIEAFRGLGKSWITDAYCTFLLYNNPNKKILLVSASSEKAEQSLSFIKYLIGDVPFLQHLKPREDQRNTVSYLDVCGAEAAEAPSLRAAGITGQITGARADIIVADDVEIPRNSLTITQRDRLSEAIKEFESIIKPGGSIIFLGTPQTEQSIYNLLPDRGYTVRVWPARTVSTEEATITYSGRLAEIISKMGADHGPQYPTEPDRFTAEDLFEREMSYGKSGFRLQFMLDTRLTDANRYPLRCSDLIVMDTHVDKAPQEVIWTSARENILEDVPCVGLGGDRFYRPQHISTEEWLPYSGSVMAIDPSGRGQDETGWAVVKYLNGFLYLVDSGGLSGGYTPDNLQFLANKARDNKVQSVNIESNFGDGMFRELLSPYITKTFPCTIEENRSLSQKEMRICTTLEPVMNQHRLIVNKKLIIDDYNIRNKTNGDENSHQYQLFYQLTRITKERGALPNDDRLDAVSMAVKFFTDQMAIEAKRAIADRKAMLEDVAIDQWLNEFSTRRGASQPSIIGHLFN